MKHFKFPWFKKVPLFFIPVSFPGWIIFLLVMCSVLWVFIYIDNRSHSASDTLRNFLAFLFLIYLAYFLIGTLASGRKS